MKPQAAQTDLSSLKRSPPSTMSSSSSSLVTTLVDHHINNPSLPPPPRFPLPEITLKTPMVRPYVRSKMPRLRWTPDLHRCFENKIGPEKVSLWGDTAYQSDRERFQDRTTAAIGGGERMLETTLSLSMTSRATSHSFFNRSHSGPDANDVSLELTLA
ncbi:hypothetical protein V8G54_034640 [Vigna mungo]|uniref:Uncharacterized protein n=1 Tax=Vigna mungo TaxID=3915 RepID=A0AAQ3MQM9_VIGMU